jgi:hypothetical protein
VALLKRLRKLPELMNRLVQSLLPDPHTGSRMFIVDGSFVCRPTAKGTDFRLHLGWEPGGMRVVQVRLTGPKPGESLQSLPWVSGSVLVGDRAYASRAGISKARAAGIDVLVRLNLTALPLQMPDGSRIDLLAVSRGLKVGEVLELDVATVPVQKPEVPSVPGRLIVIRKGSRSCRCRGACQTRRNPSCTEDTGSLFPLGIRYATKGTVYGEPIADSTERSERRFSAQNLPSISLTGAERHSTHLDSENGKAPAPAN